MKLDLEYLVIKTNISGSDTAVIDAREQLANIIYQRMPGIAALSVAQKVYKSEGETEYEEREYEIIKECVKMYCVPYVINAIVKE